jgi:hypothetical protein
MGKKIPNVKEKFGKKNKSGMLFFGGGEGRTYLSCFVCQLAPPMETKSGQNGNYSLHSPPLHANLYDWKRRWQAHKRQHSLHIGGWCASSPLHIFPPWAEYTKPWHTAKFTKKKIHIISYNKMGTLLGQIIEKFERGARIAFFCLVRSRKKIYYPDWQHWSIGKSTSW